MRYWQGILMSIVLSALIAVAIALSLSEERRRKLRSRLEELRHALPGVEQLQQSAQRAATKARETRSNLGEQVQESASKLGQRTQEMFSTVQHAVTLDGRRQAHKEH